VPRALPKRVCSLGRSPRVLARVLGDRGGRRDQLSISMGEALPHWPHPQKKSRCAKSCNNKKINIQKGREKEKNGGKDGTLVAREQGRKKWGKFLRFLPKRNALNGASGVLP